MPEIDVEDLLEQIAAADSAYVSAISSTRDNAQLALDAYVEAERRNLGDAAGRYVLAADEAWAALAAAREALAAARDAAEQVRQAAIAAALAAGRGV